MAECPQLAGKNQKESVAICLDCSETKCILDTDEVPQCTKCGGGLLSEHGRLICLKCGVSHTEKSIPATRSQQKPVQSNSRTTILKHSNQGGTTPKPRRSDILSDNGVWFAPREITFDRSQIPFLLVNLQLLREGYYPPDPRPTGYIDTRMPRKRKGQHKKAYFERPVELATEVDARLEKAGLDGLMLEFVFSSETKNMLYLIGHLANMLRTDIAGVKRRIEIALKFISGWKRKRMTYVDYRRHKRLKMEKSG